MCVCARARASHKCWHNWAFCWRLICTYKLCQFTAFKDQETFRRVWEVEYLPIRMCALEKEKCQEADGKKNMYQMQNWVSLVYVDGEVVRPADVHGAHRWNCGGSSKLWKIYYHTFVIAENDIHFHTPFPLSRSKKGKPASLRYDSLKRVHSCANVSQSKRRGIAASHATKREKRTWW